MAKSLAISLRAFSVALLVTTAAAATPDEANAACVAENEALATCLEAARRRLAEATDCETLEGFDCPEDIPKDVCQFICAQDAARPGPIHGPADVDWEEEAEWHNDRNAASADDDDAAVFCSLAVETLASQCAAPSDCPAENRARLSCYYQQLCEDPTLGCEPLATAAPAPRPTTSGTAAVPAPQPTSGASPSPTAAPTAPESDDAATIRLGGVCAAAVWLGVVVAAVWLLIA